VSPRGYQLGIRRVLTSICLGRHSPSAFALSCIRKYLIFDQIVLLIPSILITSNKGCCRHSITVAAIAMKDVLNLSREAAKGLMGVVEAPPG
jgi:hypothetical protein